MVGGGELLEQITKNTQNLPIQFLGWVDKPFENSGYFDLLLLTSKNEGMGLVMLEAYDLGATEVCIQAGLPPDMEGDLYEKICKEIKKEIPNIIVDVVLIPILWAPLMTCSHCFTVILPGEILSLSLFCRIVVFHF